MTNVPSLANDAALREQIRQFVALGTCVRRNDPCPTCVAEIGEVISIVEDAVVHEIRKAGLLNDKPE